MTTDPTPLLTARRVGRPPKNPPPPAYVPTPGRFPGVFSEESRTNMLLTADDLDKDARELAALAANLRLMVLKDRWKEADLAKMQAQGRVISDETFWLIT